MDGQGYQETPTVAQEGEKEIEKMLAPYGAFVTYVPLRTEVPFLDYTTLPTDAVTYEIMPRASLDPAEEATRAMTAVGDRLVAILIPGRLFDATGTRHGQGGGWYDRFLAQVPRAWLRVGFCYERQFSPTPLLRQSWDQAMDAVCVVGKDGVTIHRAERV